MKDSHQFSLDVSWWGLEPKKDREIWKNIIVDRGSKYSVVVGKINEISDVKIFMKKLVEDVYFRKSTHNTYAYRLKDTNGLVIEWKNDDGESWAGMCILRELKRAEFLGGIVVVTRYFWGIQLHADRFKNVIEATKKTLETIKKES